MGQKLRGGRSCPSDRKLGAGADTSGNDAAARPWGCGTLGIALSNGVAEQQAEHRLHLSWPAGPLLSWVWSWVPP